MLGHASKLSNRVPERRIQVLCPVSMCPQYHLLPGQRLGVVGYGHLSIMANGKIGDMGPDFVE